MFLKNRNISSKIKRSKVTDYAALSNGGINSLNELVFHVFCHLLIFFLSFSKNSFRNTIRGSNSLDPDQVRHFVGPDLGLNYLQRILADDTKR